MEKRGLMRPMPLPATADTPLSVRQELFVQGLASGKSKAAAYVDAGYSDRRSAWRTFSLPNVQAKYAELTAETASRARINIDEICERLMVIVDRMEESGGTVAELNLARRALMDLAKLLGAKRADEPTHEPISEIRRVIVCPDGQEWSYEELFGRPKPERG